MDRRRARHQDPRAVEADVGTDLRADDRVERTPLEHTELLEWSSTYFTCNAALVG